MQTPASIPKEPAVLLDLSAIKSGGGAQLALNFLQAVNLGRFGLRISLVLVSDEFPFRDRLQGSYAVAVAPSRVRKRILYEYRDLPKLVRAHGITHSYTFFGPGLPRMRGIRQVVGVAYPTLVYDDAAYWGNLPKSFRLKKKLQNFLRFHRLQLADHLIFETEIMERRARACGMAQGSSSVLSPTPTAFLVSSPAPSLAEHGAVVLFLSGTDPHKNLWRLPALVDALEQEKLPVRFLLSVDRNSFMVACPAAGAIPRVLMDRYFIFMGGLKADALQSAYDACNVVANLSDLESFSNNYMEAWLTGRPILASDRDFARHICGDSAIYVEPHDPASLVAGLRRFARSEVDLEKMVQVGRQAMARLPSLDDRLDILAEIIAPGTRAAAANRRRDLGGESARA